ncbi:RNA polymerase sigma factor [Streptomyces sp. NPDC002446]
MDRIDVQPLSAASAERLDRLFRLYNARLLGFAATRVRNRDIAAAEDITSETWLRAAVSLPQLLADDTHAYGWLRAIAVRAAVDHYRPRRASEEPRDWTDAMASRSLPAAPAADVVTDVFALEALSVPQCAAVKLAAQGLSNGRIARQLGKSRQAVQQNLASSARRLRAGVAA